MEHALRQFRRAPDVARKHIGNAVRVTEIFLAQRVRAGVPVLTGAYRQSIDSKTTGLRANIIIEEGEFYGGQRPAVYWRFVEFGARGKPANPVIRNAAEQESQPYVQRVRNAGRQMEADLERSA